MPNPIVDEVRRVRDEHAARFNSYLDAIFRDIKKQEKKSGRKFVCFPPRLIEPSQVQKPTGSAPAACENVPAQLGPMTEAER